MGLTHQSAFFDMLYGIIAAKGREEALLGSGIERAREAFKLFEIPCNELHLYFEIPLAGEPNFDVIIGMARTEVEAAVASGSPIGTLATLKWFHDATSAIEPEGALIGFELDANAPSLEQAGVYLVQRDHSDLVGQFLESADESTRLPTWKQFQNRLTKEWTSSYIGLFPHRLGSPMRVNAHPSYVAVNRLYESGSRALAHSLQELGYDFLNESMLSQSLEAMSHARSWDLQFDLYENGGRGDTLGLELYFGNERLITRSPLVNNDSNIRQLLQAFESWGLADKRWKLLADVAFAKRVTIPQRGNMRDFLVVVQPFSAKAKFKAGDSHNAKAYLKADIVPA